MPTSLRGTGRGCSKTWAKFQAMHSSFFAPKRAPRLEEWLKSGQYVGWLVSCASQPESIIAGAGIQLVSTLPRPLGGSTLGEGWQGIIINVFTEPQWRRQGIASMLIKEIVNWSKSEHLDWITVHASDEGRAIYERLGSDSA
jgi:GNAT superfamily N-acetyltransferase